MIYIYSPSDSERLTFVLDFCFKSKGINYTVLSSKTEFIQFKGEKINYSVEIIDDCFQIKPAALLFETSFEYLYELTFKNNAWKINNELDTFSILFYMLSSYEDYLIKDEEGFILGEFNNINKTLSYGSFDVYGAYYFGKKKENYR